MVKLFNATGWGVRWPYVLASTRYVSNRVRKLCSEYLIVDSDINNPAVTNETVIEKGVKFGADCVVPKDYKGDWQKTTQSVMQFFNYCEWDKDVIIPLQVNKANNNSYRDCYDVLSQYDAFGNWFGLGGLVGLKPREQLRRVASFVKYIQIIGHDIKIHLFGIYPRDSILLFIQQNPLIHSLDTIVCESAAVSGQVIDLSQKRHYCGHTRGKHSTKLKHLLTEYNLTVLDIIINNKDAGEKTGQKGGVFAHLKYPPSEIARNKKLTEWSK